MRVDVCGRGSGAGLREPDGGCDELEVGRLRSNKSDIR